MQGSLGVLTTVVNVYTAQDHTWSIMARVSVCVEGGCFAVCAAFFAFYRIMIWRMKKTHDAEMEAHKDDFKKQPNGDQYDEEKYIERRQSKMSNGEQSPVKEKTIFSRKSTARSTSERTVHAESPVASKRVSEPKVVDPPVEEEVVHEEHPDVILTPRRPTIDHTLTGATEVNQTPMEEVEEPTEHQEPTHQEAKAI